MDLDKKKEKISIFKEELEIKKEIEQDNLEKTNILLELGILTYEKFRKQEVYDSSFDDMCQELLDLDKKIYENNLRIENLRKSQIQIKCECNNELSVSDKFCPECGKKVCLEEENMMICEFCESKIDNDSIYCICCGKKI
ncbi:zinc ribbon domain-containing protein [Romboutsia maritimum]|uniref:Zinc ribbon domain-containing protein n=1 Tax=Romboutsia maritimum TaxID=2020948 RepID=A0A371IVT3_9FIRM|nr:zinc ribbon domain-containing protein [Romboutsia maritimum]RDY24579.1 zinc ribbon domain-containing protein [Romboutsia maritimum]